MKKLFIIGAGPGGVSTALYAKRSNIDTTIIYQNKSSLITGHSIDNYYGTPHISGKDLYEIGLKQAKDLNIPMIEEEVLAIEYNQKYEIVTKDNRYEADAIVLATGAYRNVPKVKRIKEFEGKGVSYCAMCDGFFYRKKRIAVIGSGAYAKHEAAYLKNLSDDVFVLTNGEVISDDKLNEFNLIDKVIDSIDGQDKIEKIIFKDGSELEIDGLFIAIGVAGSADLARKLGVMIDNSNKIITDENRMSNLEGLYAVGDATSGMPQVVKAVYDGALAATHINTYFKRG